MTDDLTPLESRISTIVADEERLNRERVSGMKEKTNRREAEKRKETSELTTIENAKGSQMKEIAEKERKLEEEMRREGELVNASKEIRDDYIVEMKRREDVKQKLQAKLTALETKMRSIKNARP